VKIPGGSLTDAILAGGALACGGLALADVGGKWAMVGLLACAALLGIVLVLPIGGADMPVVISLLNAFTGLSAAAYGIALNNIALIVAGAIVGASGSILTRLMGEAMNRPVLSIMAGGFGGNGQGAGAAADAGERTYRSTTAADVAIQVAYADRVLIVPGYGLAVARAQHAVHELGRLLEEEGVEVVYGIHPVAGRMPGHMNVLLAEADVPYNLLIEHEAANADMTRTDCVLVIGANDVVNPAAREDPGSPIYGMPIIDVSLARSTIVLKRSMASGYAGIENPLFFNPRCQMLFGDAKQSVTALVDEVRALLGTGSKGHSRVA
jgi:NAD(P) transhydrogenase subunit beta